MSRRIHLEILQKAVGDLGGGAVSGEPQEGCHIAEVGLYEVVLKVHADLMAHSVFIPVSGPHRGLGRVLRIKFRAGIVDEGLCAVQMVDGTAVDNACLSIPAAGLIKPLEVPGRSLVRVQHILLIHVKLVGKCGVEFVVEVQPFPRSEEHTSELQSP